MRSTWKRVQWLMGVFVWCCQPPLLFPRAFDVIDTWCFQRHKSSPTQCLAQNKKLKGGYALWSVWISTSEGQRKGGGVWGLEGTLMMGWWSRWPQTWKRCKPLALGSAIVCAGHCCIEVVSVMTNAHKSFLCHFTLDIKESSKLVLRVCVLCFTSGLVQECAELSLGKKTAT